MNQRTQTGALRLAMRSHLAIVALSGAALSATPAETVLVQAAAEGWRANRESFTQFTCRYRLITGTAGDREVALRGDLENIDEATVLWVVDGEKERCSVTATRPPNLRREPGGAGPPEAGVEGFVSEDYLAYRQIRLHSSPLLGGGTLFGPEFPVAGASNDIATPFAMGAMGPGATLTPAHYIDQWVAAGDALEVQTENSTDPVLFVRHQDNEDRSTTYEFDLGRGNITTRILHEYDKAGTSFTEFAVTDINEPAEGQWFPMRSVRIDAHPTGGKPTRYYVRVIEVTELNIGHPGKLDFELALPADAFINDASDGRSQYRLSEPTTITPEDLPDLLEKAQGRVEQVKSYQVAKAAAQQPERGWLTWVTIAVIALLGGFFMVRKLRHSA